MPRPPTPTLSDPQPHDEPVRRHGARRLAIGLLLVGFAGWLLVQGFLFYESWYPWVSQLGTYCPGVDGCVGSGTVLAIVPPDFRAVGTGYAVFLPFGGAIVSRMLEDRTPRRETPRGRDWRGWTATRLVLAVEIWWLWLLLLNFAGFWTAWSWWTSPPLRAAVVGFGMASFVGSPVLLLGPAVLHIGYAVHRWSPRNPAADRG